MSDENAAPTPEPSRQPAHETPLMRLIIGAYGGDIPAIEAALKQGARIDDVHPDTGLAPLHIAVGLNDLGLCRYLIERRGARFFPDRFGRWPTLIAAQCGVDDELSDYIVEKEAEYLAQNPA